MATKEQVKIALEGAIRNCNRNIYEWITVKKKSSHFVITYTEIRGLVKNWIIRRLKDLMGVATVDRALREGNLCISVNENDNYICSMTLTSVDNWRTLHQNIELINSAMKEINYESLRYNPNDYMLDGTTPISDFEPIYVDTSSIERIKF